MYKAWSTLKPQTAKMRNQVLREQAQTVWVLLLVSLTSYISLTSQSSIPYLSVNFDSWNLLFLDYNIIRRFYSCICSAESQSSCDISIRRWPRTNTYSVTNVTSVIKAHVISSVQQLSTSKGNVFECDPRTMVERYTFRCLRKLATNTECAEPSSTSNGLHHLGPGNRYCAGCISLCWKNLTVTYETNNDDIKPEKGKCTVDRTYAPMLTTEPAGNCTSSTTNDESFTAVPTTTTDVSDSIDPFTTTSRSLSASQSATSSVSSNTPTPPNPSVQTNPSTGTSLITSDNRASLLDTTATSNTVQTSPTGGAREEADFGISDDGGQNNQALAIGLGLGCILVTVVVLVAVYVFYRKRQKEKQEAEDRRISYIQPYGDYREEDGKCAGDNNRLPISSDGSHYDCARYSSEYQPYIDIGNTYSFIADGDKGSKRDFDNDNKATPDYELANGYPPKESILMQNIVNGNSKEEGVKGIDNPYFDLSNETTDSKIVSPEYYLGTTEVQEYNQSLSCHFDTKRKMSEDGLKDAFKTCNMNANADKGPTNVYNKLNGRSETNETNMDEVLETYNVATGENQTHNNHIYNRLNGKDVQSPEDILTNELETYNVPSGEMECKQSHTYNRLNGEAEMPDLETYNMTADKSATQQSHTYNRLNGETEMPDLETYNMAADKTAAQQSHTYNRLNGETEMPDLETYNMAADKTAAQQSHTYNRLNGETEMPDLETYNMAADDSTTQQNHIYNRLNVAAALLPDLETYNVLAGELNKSPKELSGSRISTDSGETRDPYSFATAMDNDQKMSGEKTKTGERNTLLEKKDHGQYLCENTCSVLDEQNDDEETSNAEYFTLD